VSEAKRVLECGDGNIFSAKTSFKLFIVQQFVADTSITDS
jgi:hypothetical protein